MVESSYYWSSICLRLVWLASHSSRLETGVGGIAHSLLKQMSFLVIGHFVRAPRTELRTVAPRDRKANRATAAEQVAALTFTVTGKPWTG